MFAVQSTLYYTLATIIGSLLGGYLYGLHGGKTFFIICCAINGIWATIATVLFVVSSKRNFWKN